MANQQTFEIEEIVRTYASRDELQPPEASIMSQLRDQLPKWRMLDLGVGGGRTTAHFAPLVRHYVGVDYAQKMIAACRSRFPEFAEAFHVGDVRSMPNFSDGSFDFILFSFNGLDYIPHEDRLRALREIRRVGAPGGRFCFSSHNLNTRLETTLGLPFTWHPLKLANRIVRYLRFQWLMIAFRYKRRTASHAVVNDGAHYFKSRTYYIKPDAQIGQLTQSGFTDIRVFSLADGSEITDAGALRDSTEGWLYYLCRI